MERQQLTVTKRVSSWGIVYRIGGTAIDGDILPVDEADDLIARFNFEQLLLGNSTLDTIENQLVMPNLRHLTNAVSLC